MDIGWIGIGVMGVSMAGHLQRAGHSLKVFSRTKAKAEGLLARGAIWAETPRAVAESSDVTFTMVGYPRDVEEIYLGADGILAGIPSGSIAVDATTSSPSLARRVAQAAAERGAAALDAPVSGGDIGARNATLSIMVGGDETAFHRVKPLFEQIGRTIVLQGPAGSGQHTKMVNQILLAGTMVSLAEGLLYARSTGLNPDRVLESVGGGAAASWSLQNLLPRILKGDLEPGLLCRTLHQGHGHRARGSRSDEHRAAGTRAREAAVSGGDCMRRRAQGHPVTDSGTRSAERQEGVLAGSSLSYE